MTRLTCSRKPPILELAHGGDQFLQVLKPPRRFRRLVRLPHLRVAGLVQHHLGDLGMRRVADRVRQRSKSVIRLRSVVRILGFNSSVWTSCHVASVRDAASGAGKLVELLDRRRPDTAFGRA